MAARSSTLSKKVVIVGGIACSRIIKEYECMCSQSIRFAGFVIILFGPHQVRAVIQLFPFTPACKNIQYRIVFPYTRLRRLQFVVFLFSSVYLLSVLVKALIRLFRKQPLVNVIFG